MTKQLNSYRTLFTFIFIICGTQIYSQININDIDSKRIESDNSIIWQQVSPGNGGMSNTLRYHPTILNHVTFLGDMWCAYQSVDNGNKWYSITDHDGSGDFQRQRDLLYATDDPSFGISICSSQMYKTEDTGKSWQPVKNCPWYQLGEDGLDRSSWQSKVGGLGIDPSNKNIWFVGGGKLVRGDVSFSCFNNPTQAEPYQTDVNNKGKLWRTKNGGSSWDEVGGDINSEAQIGPIKIHPKNSQLVFAATTHGVYRSTDGGDNWINITLGKIDNNIIMDLDYYYNADTDKFILYIIDQVQFLADGTTTKSSGGVYESSDSGDTWKNINGNLYLDLNRLSGSVDYYYYRYLANWFGLSQSQVQNTYPNLPTKALQPMDQLATDPTREGALYIGLPSTHSNNSITPGRLWATSDGGNTWENTARLYTHVWEQDKDYWEERENPWEQNMEIGVESKHIQWGNNYALRGTRGLDVGLDGSVMMLSEHTTSLSKDHGKTWEQVDSDYTPSGAFLGRGNSDLPAHVVSQDKRLAETYLGSGEHRLWITTDDSPDERQGIKNIMNSVETISTIAFDPYDANIVYTTSSRQAEKQYIYRSDDAGENWKHHGVATPGTDTWADDFYTNALTIDPIDNNYMYHGITRIDKKERANEGGFFRSTDGGKTFSQSNKGLPSPCRVKDIQFDPRDNTRASLFIAAEKYSFNYNYPQSEGGLYHSNDRGLNWTKVNTPSSIEGVQHIRIDQTNRIYITTGYRGGGNGVWYSDNYGENWTQIFSNPSVEHIDISPYDHNLIAITIKFLSKNPGVYISRDRGITWNKSNTNIVVPQHIEALKFDLHDAGQIWIGTLGTGFYKGQIENGDKIQVIQTTPTTISSNTTLTATIVNQDYAGTKITWHSDNPSVAVVDQNGNVTQTGKGTAKIWATAANGRFSDYSIAVFSEEPPIDPENLLSDNYTIKTFGITCLGKENGSINIVSKKKGKFNVNLNTDSYNKNFSFENELNIPNLKPGTYNGIIKIEGNTDYKQSFSVVVANAEDLSVTSKLLKNKNAVELNLSGGSLYIVEFNGDVISTSQKTIELNLKEGENQLSVKTNKECQGKFSKKIELQNVFFVKPIPSSDIIYLNSKFPITGNVEISIYNPSGTLVLNQRETKIDHTAIDVSHLSSGMYFLKFKSKGIQQNKKILIN